MEIRVLEFSMETNEVINIEGTTVCLDNCKNVYDAVVAYAEDLSTNRPEIVVIKPLFVLDSEGEIKTHELWNIEEFGVPCITVEDLGLDIKPLSKESVKMDINEVVDGLEEDVKEAINMIVEDEEGNLSRVETSLKRWLAQGKDAYDWVQTKLTIASIGCRDKINNSYVKANNKINEKITKLLTTGKDSKKNILKRIGSFVLVVVLQVLKALAGIVKFAADIIVCVAKYVGCTVVVITKQIGTLAADVVKAFKRDLIDIYRQPVTA